MGELPPDYLDFQLCVELHMDPDELDKKPMDKVELWGGYLVEYRKAKRLEALRNAQANGK